MLETPEVVINPGSIQAEVECNKDLEITLQKREFSIVGDNVYVTTSSEAPQWLLDLINGTIANAIAEGTADFDDLRENILNAIAAMNIAKNDYDSYVIKLEDAEGRLLAYTETLNATVADSVAQIVSTLVTKVTADEALTIAVDAIQSSINGGAIKAQIDTINTTLATESLSRATQVDTIMAAITDESSGLAANATAIEILDATVTANQTASATWQTNLETFLETGDTTGTTIDSQSNVYSILRSDITSAESKFEYNSNLIINGHPYSSGFGLVSNLTVNSNDEPIAPNLAEGDSEFWIKADRFKLTAANGLVSNYVPFEVDGTTGDIKFKGKVTFSSISDASTNIPTISSVTTAQSTANTASTNASAALTKLTDLASDNILSAVEKPTAIKEYNIIIAEQTGIDSQATAYSITTEKTAYDTAVSNLTTYLNGLTVPTAWNSTTGDTTIVGTTFRSKFEDVYTTKQTLLNKIYASAKAIADTAQSSANAAQSTANAVNASLTNNAYWQTQVQTALDEDTTIIDGSHIATGSIWLGGNIKTYNYNWNNGFPVGFGLFSIGDTDSQEYYNIVGGKLYGATINGANIKGAVFDIATAQMQSAVDGNTGSFIPTSLTFGGGSLQSDYFYAPGYGTGYNPNRIARDSTEFLIKCVSGGSFALYYQINDSTWTAFPDCGPSNPSYITYVGRNTYSFANGKIRFKAVTTSGNTTLSLDITAPAVYVNRYKAIYTVNGTYSFVVPAGITTLEYIVYGAGGGSGANNRDGDCDSGSGGGAGGKITGSLTVTPGETLTVIVGERGYGASYHFNSSYLPNYNAQGQQISYGTGTAGNSSYLKRGGTTIATATGGQPGWQTGSGAAGGTPYVDGTNNGRGASSILYYTGAISGGTNGSGTPPNTYSEGSGYGNGGGQSTATRGTNGQNGAVLLYWELTT